MPRYDVECPICGTYERATSIADRRERCGTCGSEISILITTSTKSKGFEPYFDIGLGIDVTGQGDINREMRRNQIDRRDPPSRGDQTARFDKMHERRRREMVRP